MIEIGVIIFLPPVNGFTFRPTQLLFGSEAANFLEGRFVFVQFACTNGVQGCDS